MMMTAALLGGAVAQETPEQGIGLLSKVVVDVTRKPANQEWTAAARGQALDSGDMIKTGEKSLAVVKFKDNSLLRIRELSLVTLTGTSSAGAFSKQVQMGGGAIGFSVQKQRPNEEFRFTTPTSVASIRGTMGLFATTDTLDLLLVTEGVVRLMNTRTNESVDVGAGQAGESTSSGRLSQRPLTDAELQSFRELFGSTGQGEGTRQLKLQLRNERGELRELIIEIAE
jgi:hypothetical protein